MTKINRLCTLCLLVLIFCKLESSCPMLKFIFVSYKIRLIVLPLNIFGQLAQLYFFFNFLFKSCITPMGISTSLIHSSIQIIWIGEEEFPCGRVCQVTTIFLIAISRITIVDFGWKIMMVEKKVYGGWGRC